MTMSRVSKESHFENEKERAMSILDEFVSKIGITIGDHKDNEGDNNDENFVFEKSKERETSIATKEEAQLLMNLLSPVPYRDCSKQVEHRSVVDSFWLSSPLSSPSCIGHVSSYRRGASPTEFDLGRPLLNIEDHDAFRFECPSLSLICNELFAPPASSFVSFVPAPGLKSSLKSSLKSGLKSSLKSSLKSRSKSDSNIVPPSPSLTASIANSTANGTVGEVREVSIIGAGAKRKLDDSTYSTTKETMMLSLADLLSRQISSPVRVWKDVSSHANDLAENIRSTFEFVTHSRIQSWMESVSQVLRLQERASRAGTKAKPDPSKRKVLRALSMASSKLRVSKIKTHFRPIKTGNPHGHTSRAVSPSSSKKQKHDQHDQHDQHNQHHPQQLPLELRPPLSIAKSAPTDDSKNNHVSHHYPLELVVTIEMAPYNLNLQLKAPGALKGFFKSNHTNQLAGVTIDLDMAAFVHHLRKQSRFAARKAAEAEIVHLPNLMKHQNSNPNQQCNTAMPPPPPRKDKAHSLGIVSPTPGSPTAFTHTSVNNHHNTHHNLHRLHTSSPNPNGTYHNHHLPHALTAPFVSPSGSGTANTFKTLAPSLLSRTTTDCSTTANTATANATATATATRGPSLPVLVEVACDILRAGNNNSVASTH